MFKGNNNAVILTVNMENLTLIMNYNIITCGILYEKIKTFFLFLLNFFHYSRNQLIYIFIF